MAIKWKGWTSRQAVKIISFLLILALGVVAINRAVAVLTRSNEAGVGMGIVFVDLSEDDALDASFFERNMHIVYPQAVTVLHYRSEEAILSGEFVRWESQPILQSMPAGYEIIVDDVQMFGHLHIHHADGSGEILPVMRGEAQQIMERTMQMQLNEFRMALANLNTTPGLLYFVTSGDTAHYNTRGDMSYFTSQPAYLVVRAGETVASNFFHFNFWPQPSTRGAIMLAFTSDVVGVDIDTYSAARAAYVRDFILIAAAVTLAVALFVILLVGTGRKYGVEGVHFAPTDKPYLDLSLAALIAWTIFIAFIVFELERLVWHNNNVTALTILLSAAAVLVAAPLILWIMSLVKRMKAGGFWRYTLIFSLPRWLFRHAVRGAKSLWAGVNLTVKVTMILLATLICVLVVGFVGLLSSWNAVPMVLMALLFTAIVAVLLLRYARRIHKLTQGAYHAESGVYEGEINAGGGELGRIASSINNISAGINSAVEARLKSERLKTELITNVSHDIRTPLTSIITYTDLLKHEGLDCEQASVYLDILIQKSQRLKTLTDELFEASKAASGNIEANITELCLVSLINQVLGELDGAIKSSGLVLRVNLPERLMVMADGRLMWRVMENLLSNVFKYALPGSRVYLDAVQEESLVRVELKNISATELNVDPSELTERFKRGDDSRADGGSGLGLSIVQSFVAAQGGKFEISIDGDLFKANVYLPAATGEAPAIDAMSLEIAPEPVPTENIAQPRGFSEKLRALKGVFRG